MSANQAQHDPESEPASETTTLLPTDHHSPDPENTPKMSSSLFWKVGAIYGAAAVGLGAFGAHGLKKRISDPNKIASWSTAAHYQVRQLIYLFNLLLPSSGMLMRLTQRVAGPLGRHPRRESSPRRFRPLHRRHDHVQRQHLCFDPRYRALQVLGSCDTSRRSVSDCGLVGAGFCVQGDCRR